MKKTYVYIDGELVEKGTAHYEPFAPMVMGDINPYRSMVDGSMIEGRRQHRDHLKQHNCIEVGNEKMETKLTPPKDNRREILRAQLDNMTHDQANKIMSSLRQDPRFYR